MASWKKTLKRIDDYRGRLPVEYKAGMRVPGLIYADATILETMFEDQALEQVANVAFLPGIVRYSLAMPDIHWGYGFPVGGVAAPRVEDGVISPGGVGFDINCGTRVMRTNLGEEDVRPLLPQLLNQLFRDIPAADPAKVSRRAKERGIPQLGTLGSGNHFLEVQLVDEIYDEGAAHAMGIGKTGQVVIFLHTGSRGLGHQVCQDYLDVMEEAMGRYKISLPDKQLACAPISSPEGQDYLAAMTAAANFAFANRQMITHWVRKAFVGVLGLSEEGMG